MTPDIHKEVCDPKNIVGWIIGDDPSPQEIEAVIRHALTTEAARVRGETWREAIQLARFGAMELRAMHDDRKADFFGHGPAALQDFADQLEEKAKQADHFVDANNKVSQWSTERPPEEVG